VSVLDFVGTRVQTRALDLHDRGHPGVANVDERRLYVSEGGYVRAIDPDGFDQFDVNQTIFSYRGAGRKWIAGLSGRSVDNPVKMIWWGDSVTELMYGAPVYRFRERLARFNGGVVSPGWINAAPLSSDTTGGVNVLQPYVFRLSTGSYGASGGTENIAQERGLGLYAFRLASGSTLTLYEDPNQDGTWSDQVAATPDWARAEIHYAACGTDASVGSLEFRVNGVLEEVMDGYDSGLGSGVWESAHKVLWDPEDGDAARGITLTATGGSFIIEGIYLANDDETVWCYNGGNAGEKYEDLLATFTGHAKASAWEVMESLAVDAVQFAFGINDYGDGAQDMYDDVAEVITQARLATTDPSIGVLVPYATSTRADWPDWVVAAKDACSDKGVPVLDTSWMLNAPAGTADPDELIGPDNVHQLEAGGELWANLVSKFWIGDDINWVDVLALAGGLTLSDVQSGLLTGDISATFTGSGFGAGLTITKYDTGKAYLLLQDDKGSATTGLFGEISANGRGATTLLGSSGINGLAGFRFRAASTWTDTSAPTDIEVINCATSSTTVAVRATFLAGGGLKFPEMTPPAGVANNVILCGRDDGELVMVRPDSSIEPIASRAPRVVSITSSGTPTPNADITDLYLVTALAATAAWGAPTGTIAQGQKLMLRIKDNGTARTMSWDGVYRAIGVTLPLTTVISKTLYIGMVYNFTDTKWDVLAVGQEA
jgi:hypothetical protein